MIFTRPDQVNEPLYVITPIFNSQRYRVRWKLWADFAKMIEEGGGILYTVEVAFGERDFALEHLNPKNYIKLRTNCELWHKERAINIAFTKLPIDWKYAAWIDADIDFARGDFINETLHKLQHYKVVQMWSQSVDLSPEYEILRTFKSFYNCYHNQIPKKGPGCDNYTIGGEYYHPGYAHAIRREAYDQLGGLIDFAILGGADMWMCHMLAGLPFNYPKSLGKSGINRLEIWRDRADKYIKKNVGFVSGLITHFWHGKKESRRYQDRGTVLVDACFNPDIDLIPDTQGLYQLNPENIKLRDGIRKYLSQRNEDGVDI